MSLKKNCELSGHDDALEFKSTGDVQDSDIVSKEDVAFDVNEPFDIRNNLFKSYRNNKQEFSQVPFWFWNDELNVEKITQQIVDFQRHGVHAFVIHPRAGLPRSSGWMSADMLEHMRFAIDQAVARNMWVILYDEAMYPSGSSAGQVVEENPSYACRGLVQIDLDVVKSGETHELVKIGDKGIMLNSDQNLVAKVQRKHDGHKIAIVDTPIQSRIRGVHFLEDDPVRRDDKKEVEENHPLAGDLLNPEAMQCFIRLVYQRFYNEFGDQFGKTIKAIFTDEPDMLGKFKPKMHAMPGTTGIIEHVNKYLGYDFTPHLPALWDVNEPDALRYRKDYHRAILHRLEQTYYKPISDWCSAHGISLTGHPAKSDDIGLLRYFHIPGQDVVIRYIEPNKDSALVGEHSTMAKCASSAMLHLGRQRNLNEFAGAYGHDLTFREYRWLALWLLIRGCNLLVPHAFYYSTRGPRVDERPRDVGPNSPWWKDYKNFAEMTGRMCWMNTDSVHHCNIAILGQNDRLPWESAKVFFENQLDFNYLEDYHLLNDVKIGTKGLEISGMCYSCLIVEKGFESALGEAAEKVLGKIRKKVGLIIWDKSEGESSLLDQIALYHQPGFNFSKTHKGLRVRRITKEDEEYLMLFNESEIDFIGKLSIQNQRTANMIDMDDSKVTSWHYEDTIHIVAHKCYVFNWIKNP
jgi:hypothetical protein